MKIYLTTLLIVATACGDDKKDPPYAGPCETEVPTDVAAKIEEQRKTNEMARDLAVEAERTRLGVTPLKPTTVIGHGASGTNEYKPQVDPFPNSVVVVGDPTYDVRTKGYQLNHGMMDMETVYETEPGSGKFFIVDLIDGDGMGGNGKEVAGYSVEYGLISQESDLSGDSWHSWHVSPENLLVRATQKVEETITQEISICGCGPYYEVESASLRKRAADFAPEQYPVAIFMLPGTAKPTLSTDAFVASYKRSYVKQKQVPHEGHTCRENDPNVVC